MTPIRVTYDGVAPLLGLEPRDEGGWVHHMVDPARLRTRTGPAQCGTIIRVTLARVDVLGILDLTCPACEAYWLAEYRRIRTLRAGILGL